MLDMELDGLEHQVSYVLVLSCIVYSVLSVVLSCLVLSCLALSCLVVLTCPALPCPVLSCLVFSYAAHILLFVVWTNLFCLVVSWRVVSSLVYCCLLLSSPV